ncbi:MAG: hypothetical protein LBT06_17200 [Hungatella sp.]|jgi:hypothetical protein|nr:hypothetical protein [Hungatella sp.]
MMKKLLTGLVLLAILISIFVCSTALLNSQPKETISINESELVFEAYREFLKGERNVIFHEQTIGINKIISSEMEIDRNYNARYALFDTNGDGLPELHILSQNHYYILSFKDGNLIVWAELTPYYEQLNNRAFLHIRPGGTPLHISSIYIVMDFSGNEMVRIFFEKYDIDENGVYDDNDRYFFEDVEVSKKDWDTLTEKYLSIGSDQIKWFDYSEGEPAF